MIDRQIHHIRIQKNLARTSMSIEVLFKITELQFYANSSGNIKRKSLLVNFVPKGKLSSLVLDTNVKILYVPDLISYQI